jgi:YD repeat-containing protein
LPKTVSYTVEHRFDADGNEIETIDQNGKSTRYAFDTVNRTTSMTDANGITTAYTYDGNDNILGITITAAAGADAISTVTPTSGADIGKFILAELRTPATYLVQLVLEGYGTQTLTVQVGPGEPHVLTASIIMSKGTGVIRGAVTDSTGVALGGVSVTASNGAVVGQTVSVDSGGFYSLSGLAAPGNYILTFSKEGYATEVVGISLSSSLGAATSNVILIKATSSIAGIINTSAGTSLSGATIVATSGLISLSTLSTDPSGAFRIEGLTGGWWTVTASLPGYSDAVLLIQVGAVDQNLGSITINQIAT